MSAPSSTSDWLFNIIVVNSTLRGIFKFILGLGTLRYRLRSVDFCHVVLVPFRSGRHDRHTRAPASETATIVSFPTPQKHKSPPQPLPLSERVPTAEQVLKRVQEDELLIHLFKDSFWVESEDQQVFYDSTLWEEVAQKIECAIDKYTPTLEKDMKAKAARFEGKMRKIHDFYICKYPLFSPKHLDTMSNCEKDHACCLIFHIGGLFI